MREDNIVLIGMSGAGKSTLGVLLAKALGRSFIDTDILIQQKEEKLLQDIIDSDGMSYFMGAEEDVLSSLDVHGCVIATGGSAVYSEKAMKHLKESAVIIYLEVDYDELVSRLSNITTRGIVFKGKHDLRSVYDERLPLYERYADVRVRCSGKGIEDCVREIVVAVQK